MTDIPDDVVETVQLTKRELKCLRRIADRRPIPDTSAADSLWEKGMIEVTTNEDDFDVKLTDRGVAMLAAVEGDTREGE